MSDRWPVVELGEVLTHRKEFTTISDLETYKRCRVQLHAKGIVLRDTVLGAEIRTKKQQVCRAGEFLVAEIDAKVGGYGIVPDALDRAIVSSHYFLFHVDDSVLDRNFLSCFVRTPAFDDQVSAQGSTNYAAIRPQQVLEYEIPLPPLDEQWRIVAHIEELASRIEEARGLRAKAVGEAEMLWEASSDRIFAALSLNDINTRLEAVTERVTKGESPKWQGFDYVSDGPLFLRSQNVLWGYVDITSATRVPQAFHDKLSRSALRPGDVLINLVGASIGRSAVVPDKIGDANINQAVAVISPTPQLNSRFLMSFLISPLAQRVLHMGKVETARPNITLTGLRKLTIPIPSLPEQHRIVAYLDALQAKVDALEQLQANTQAELDALLPSVLDKAFRGE